MEWFDVEFAFRPPWETIHHVALADISFPSTRPVSRLGKFVFESLIGSHADQKNSPAVLRNAIVFCIEDGPFHSITGRPITSKLVAQQIAVLTEHHPVDIFDHEGFWEHLAQHTIKLAV